jgi:hypothetical protein
MKQSKPCMSSKPPLSAFAVLICLMYALAGAGCQSTGEPASASFASVTISNHSAAEIAAATAQVFGADGYRGGPSGPGQMLFEKEASLGTTLSRDGLVAAQSGARSLNRVRVEIVPLSGGAFRLQCQAYVVSGGSDPFFQEEVRLTSVRSGPYRSLLNKVANQLK